MQALKLLVDDRLDDVQLARCKTGEAGSVQGQRARLASAGRGGRPRSKATTCKEKSCCGSVSADVAYHVS